MNSTYAQVEKTLRTPFLYLSTLLQDRSVASVMPSTHFVCSKIVKHLNSGKNQTIVEFGAGDGVVTEAMLSHLSPSSRIYAFETNLSMVDAFTDRINDSRVDVLNKDAFFLSEFAKCNNLKADAVISGIPLTMFSRKKKLELIRDVYSVLRPGGVFITYQMWLPPFYTCSSLRQDLKTYFEELCIEDVYLNIPPLRIIVSGRPQSPA